MEVSVTIKRRSLVERHELFVEKVKGKFGEEEYTVLGTYVNAETKIKMKHTVCNYEWDVLPRNFLNSKSKCPKCNRRIKYTAESFKQLIFSLVGVEYHVLGDYTSRRKIKMKHNICGFEWCVSTNSFVNRGSRCPLCAGLAAYTTERFKNKVNELVGNEYRVLGDYVNSSSKIEMLHEKCGNSFYIKPNSFIHGNSRCLYCHKEFARSYGESEIAAFLQENGIPFIKEFTFESCRNINPLPFDFAIFNFNYSKLKFLIEFDGRQHYKSVEWFGGEETFEKITKNDEIKNEYCKNNNIKLIRIPYWDFDRIQEILSAELKTSTMDIKSIPVSDELEDEWERQLRASSFLFVVKR